MFAPKTAGIGFIRRPLSCTFEKIGETSAFSRTEACYERGETVVVRLDLVANATRSATGG